MPINVEYRMRKIQNSMFNMPFNLPFFYQKSLRFKSIVSMDNSAKANNSVVNTWSDFMVF